MKRQRLHETATAVAVIRLAKFLRIAPVETLPELFAISRCGIGRGTHAREIKLLVVRCEVQRKDSAGVVMTLDDSPTREARRRKIRDLLAAGEFPHAHFAHEISRREKFSVAAERGTLNRRHMAEAMNEFGRARIVDPHRRITLRQRLVFVTATNVLAFDRCNERAGWGSRELPRPELMRGNFTNRLSLVNIVPLQRAVITGRDKQR